MMTKCMHTDGNRDCFHPASARLTAIWLAGEIEDIDDDSFTGW